MADAYKRKKMKFYHLQQNGISIGFCPFRPAGGVECPVVHDCRKCGWHPAVEEERKKRVREMLEEPQVDTYSIGHGSIDPAIKK